MAQGANDFSFLDTALYERCMTDPETEIGPLGIDSDSRSLEWDIYRYTRLVNNGALKQQVSTSEGNGLSPDLVAFQRDYWAGLSALVPKWDDALKIADSCDNQR